MRSVKMTLVEKESILAPIFDLAQGSVDPWTAWVDLLKENRN